MSIPRPDPNFTMADLSAVGKDFIDAGKRYWEAFHKAGLKGDAVVWLTADTGEMVIFTRGEYRQTLMANIERLGPTYNFGGVSDQ